MLFSLLIYQEGCSIDISKLTPLSLLTQSLLICYSSSLLLVFFFFLPVEDRKSMSSFST